MRAKYLLTIVLMVGGLALAIATLPGLREPLQTALRDSGATGQADAAPTDGANNSNHDTKRSPKIAPLPVRGMVVNRAPFTLTVPASGRAEARRRLELAPRVSGLIQGVLVREGDHVRKGQPLVTFDSREFEIALLEAQAREANAKVDAEVRLLNDPDITEEKKILVEHRSGLTEARQQVARAGLDLEGTTLTAPFDAHVAAVTAVEGAAVGAQSSLVTLVDLTTIRVAAEVLESSFGALAAGIEAGVRFASIPDREFLGTVAALSPEVDPNRGTGIAYIDLANPEGRIKPGMYAEAQLMARIYEERLAVPRAAVLERERRLLVFAVKNDRAQWQYVETGLETDEWVEITSGISPGDTILIEGHLTLAHAAPVKVTVAP